MKADFLQLEFLESKTPQLPDRLTHILAHTLAVLRCGECISVVVQVNVKDRENVAGDV